MGGLIPLTDASRRPVRVPLITGLIILVNAVVFVMELVYGDPFVMQWSAIPVQIVSGHRWITVLTAMFMHASWSHIIGPTATELIAESVVALELECTAEHLANIIHAHPTLSEAMLDASNAVFGMPINT